ncbi:hypothetical protein D3C75_534020 [compost metagenome]
MVQRFHKLIATIRVAREICFTNARNNRFGFNLIRINCGQRQEQNIAPWNEGAGNAAFLRVVIRHRNVIARQAADSQFVQQCDIQNFVGTSA